MGGAGHALVDEPVRRLCEGPVGGYDCRLDVAAHAQPLWGGTTTAAPARADARGRKCRRSTLPRRAASQATASPGALAAVRSGDISRIQVRKGRRDTASPGRDLPERASCPPGATSRPAPTSSGGARGGWSWLRAIAALSLLPGGARGRSRCAPLARLCAGPTGDIACRRQLAGAHAGDAVRVPSLARRRANEKGGTLSRPRPSRLQCSVAASSASRRRTSCTSRRPCSCRRGS